MGYHFLRGHFLLKVYKLKEMALLMFNTLLVINIVNSHFLVARLWKIPLAGVYPFYFVIMQKFVNKYV